MIAVALAATLVAAVAGASGTIAASAEKLLSRTAGLADLRVKHRYNGRLAEPLVGVLAKWPEVKLAAGSIETGATVRRVSGGRGEAVMVQGVEPALHERVEATRLESGRAVLAEGEIVLDGPVSRALGVTVGGEVEVTPSNEVDQGLFAGVADRMLGKSVSGWFRGNAKSGGVKLTLRVVGILDRPKLKILQRPFGMVALPQAQQLAGAPGRIDTVDLVLRDHYDAEAVEKSRAADLPPDARFRGAAAAAANMHKALTGMRVALSLITMIVFLSAGFIITTGLTTAVTERTRELAILRCIGAERGVIAASQLLAGVAISTAGGLLGLPLGLALAYTLYRRHSEVLIAGFRPSAFGIGLVIGGSILAGLLGALYPAVRAARVRPLRALASRAVKPTTRGVILCLSLGVLFAALPPLLMALPIPTDKVLWLFLALGLPLTFTGYFLLAVPVLFILVGAVVPTLAALFRVPRDVLRQSLAATPYRHGFTAGSLMVGLAMLIVIWTNGRSLMTDWFDNIRMPDGFACRMGSFGLVPLTPAEYAALKSTPGIATACPTAAFPVAALNAQFDPADSTPNLTLYVSFDPGSFFNMTSLTWVQGDPESAKRMLSRGKAVLVSREYLKAHGLGLGSKLTLRTVEGPVDFDVAGVISSPGLDIAVQYFGINRYYAQASVSSVFGSRTDAARYFGNDQMNLILLTFKPGVRPQPAIDAVLAAVPGITATSAREILDTIRAMSQRFLSIASLLAGATLLIACFGVGNLIVANIASRRFEYGVLRAVGSPRWMLGRLILAETTAMALVACVTGVLLGLQLALVARELHGRVLGLVYGLHAPWGVIAGGAGVVIAVALLAAAAPIARLVFTPPRVLLASE